MSCTSTCDKSQCTNQKCTFAPTIHHMVADHSPTVEEGTAVTDGDLYEIFQAECHACISDEKETLDLCEHCRHLRLRHLLSCLAKRKASRHPLINLGILSDIQERHDCPFCSTITKVFGSSRYDRPQDIHIDDRIFLFPRVDTLDSKYRRKILPPEMASPTILFFTLGKSVFDGDLSVAVERYARVRVTGDMLDSSRTASPKRKDPDHPSLPDWINESVALHNKKDMTKSSTPIGFKVIDIYNNCITSSPKTNLYAALSYVWGQKLPEELESTKSNIDGLSVPKSLSRACLPKSITDAMGLCQDFSIPYLWVDRLCIVQDDGVQKHDQISAMDEIYSGAAFTICATAGTSSRHGLPGYAGTSHKFARKNLLLGKDILIEPIMPAFDECMADGAWYERGWTFQETLLGGRLLLFTEWQRFYRSHGSVVMSEDPVTEIAKGWILDSLDTPDVMPDDDRTRFTSIAVLYKHYLNQFSGRKLSYVTDTFDAFKGVFKSLYDDLDDYIYGIPESDFDALILWSARPLPELLPPEQFKAAVLPTWSWGSLMHWTHEILYVPQGVIGSVARWRRLQSDGQTRIVQATWDPSADQSIYCWKQSSTRPTFAVDPRPYMLASWRACIEAPFPDVKVSSSTAEQDIITRWPTYEEFWTEAHESTPFSLPADTLSLLTAQPGRIAARSTTNSFWLWAGQTIGLSRDYYILDSNGWCIGSSRIPQAIATYNGLPTSGLIQGDDITLLALSLHFDADTVFFENLKRKLPNKDRREGVVVPPFCKEARPESTLRDALTGQVMSLEPVLLVMLLGWRDGVAHRI